ncbi:MAG: metal-dependent hydrolase [Chitinophagaceae bacterium]|nr:MAG: metal-dependent hydrolase [Chitinophagaceae bacterium]
MKLTYYGHASFSVEAAGKHLLFDPFITPNGAAKDIDVNGIPADYLLLSHGHGDHVADAPAIAQRTGATVIAGYEVAEWMGKQGSKNNVGMNHGGKKSFDFGTVKCVSAIHSSGLPDGSYGGNPMGFVVTAGDKSFYYSGDTALTMDMQLIPRWARIDFAVLCIGDHFTMGYEDAVEAARMVGTQTVVGVHYDTFPPIAIDKEAAKAAFEAAGIRLLLPAIGETVDL